MNTSNASFHGFGHSSASNGNSIDPNATLVQHSDPLRTSTPIDGSTTTTIGSGPEQRRTYGGEIERNLTHMCDMISSLQHQMLEAQRHSEKREEALVQRLLELEVRVSAKSDSQHDSMPSPRVSTAPKMPKTPDVSPAVLNNNNAVLNNNNACSNASNNGTHSLRSSATTAYHAPAAYNNKTVYTQPYESDLIATTQVVYAFGQGGAAYTSVVPHSRVQTSSSAIHAPTHVRPAHVYTAAPWSAASTHVPSSQTPALFTSAYTHVPSSQTPALFTSAHADRYVNRSESIHPEGYFVQMPQSVPPRPHSESPWPIYAASQPQINAAAAYGPAAVARRTEHRRLYDLPPFTGLPEDWPKFEQSYRNTTEAYGYDNVDNLLRLQKSLSGEAERAVESLLIHPGHVQLVMETLFDTFGHPDLLIRSQIERARRLTPVNEAHLELLVPFANVVRNVATYLDAPNTQHHLADPILLEELVSKLPGPRRVDWAAVATQIRPYATVRDFSVWISSVARLVRHAYPASTVSKPTSLQSSAAGRTNTKPQATKRVLLSATNIAEDAQRTKCSYCKKEHDTEQCYWFKRLSANERWRVVKEGAWCYGCLADSHILPSCGVKRKCAVGGCNEWHHSVLHERSETYIDRPPAKTQVLESLRMRLRNNSDDVRLL